VARRDPGGFYDYMAKLHTSPFQKQTIAEINRFYKVDLAIMDATEGFVKGGPERGERAKPNLILASSDRVAIDAVSVQGVNQLSVRGLMEPPLACDVHEETSSVLRRMIDGKRTCALIGFGELQGIVTYRDFVKLLVNRKKEVGIPVYMMGQPDNAFEAEAARAKFVRSINLLAKSFPEILEVRSMVKTTTPKGKKGRKHYEVKTSVYTPQKMFVHSESGWDLASIFDVIGERLGKIVTKQTRRRGRTKRWSR
jgi:hypothetical protein